MAAIDIHPKLRTLSIEAMDCALEIETWAYQLERPEPYLAAAKKWRELSAQLRNISRGEPHDG